MRKKIVISLLSLGVVVFGADQTLNARIFLYDKMVTPLEYSQEKTRLIEKMDLDKLTFNEVGRWNVIANNDIRECGQIELKNVTEKDIVKKVNKWMKDGSKCK